MLMLSEINLQPINAQGAQEEDEEHQINNIRTTLKDSRPLVSRQSQVKP